MVNRIQYSRNKYFSTQICKKSNFKLCMVWLRPISSSELLKISDNDYFYLGIIKILTLNVILSDSGLTTILNHSKIFENIRLTEMCSSCIFFM